MASTENLGALPRWDMTPFFPSLDAASFEKSFSAVKSGIADLRALMDEFVIREGGALLDEISAAGFEKIVVKQNDFTELLRMIRGFINSHVTTDSRNTLAQARLSELAVVFVELETISVRQRGWLRSIDVESLIAHSDVLKDHAFPLRKAAQSAKYLMTEPEESLAANLAPAGASSWLKLHFNVSSQVKVKVSLPDGEKELPMSAVRGLAHHEDPAVREAGYRAEMGGWESVSVPMAAALNSIKGWTSVLNEGRGWKDSLEPVLFDNNISRDSLEAMQEACRASFPDFRLYLQAKARILGHKTLPWWDLVAPVGGRISKSWTFEAASEFIIDNFASCSAKMGDLAARAFAERWIDAEPRDGKRDGAFCMGVRGEESRILTSYEGSFNSVAGLAHELGHAYHNSNLAKRTEMQRQTPVALAETASIFCQTVVTQAAIDQASDEEKLSMLEHDIQDACQSVVDIFSRFLFEKRVFEGRSKRELSVGELNELMIESQKETYGDGLDAAALHPYAWVGKPHYYITSYYNWPYTFGHLFALGLYARFREVPEEFRGSYDKLLSLTGMADAAELTGRFGMDITSVEFWSSSLDILRERIREYEELTAEA